MEPNLISSFQNVREQAQSLRTMRPPTYPVSRRSAENPNAFQIPAYTPPVHQQAPPSQGIALPPQGAEGAHGQPQAQHILAPNLLAGTDVEHRGTPSGQQEPATEEPKKKKISIWVWVIFVVVIIVVILLVYFLVIKKKKGGDKNDKEEKEGEGQKQNDTEGEAEVGQGTKEPQTENPNEGGKQKEIDELTQEKFDEIEASLRNQMASARVATQTVPVAQPGGSQGRPSTLPPDRSVLGHTGPLPGATTTHPGQLSQSGPPPGATALPQPLVQPRGGGPPTPMPNPAPQVHPTQMPGNPNRMMPPQPSQMNPGAMPVPGRLPPQAPPAPYSGAPPNQTQLPPDFQPKPPVSAAHTTGPPPMPNRRVLKPPSGHPTASAGDPLGTAL